MEFERNQSTLGKVAGREVTRLQSDLRLHLLRKEFDAIVAAQPPDGLVQTDLKAANDTLVFYRALAELSRPDGNLEVAEQSFLRLHESRADVASYIVNLFAARVSILLARNPFGRVNTNDRLRARRFLAEADSALDSIRGLIERDRAIHNNNRTLLFLAIGQPERAFEVLQMTPDTMGEERTACLAVALSRMGRSTDALEALQRAEGVLGNSEILRAARVEVERGTLLDAHTDISVSTSEDAAPSISKEQESIAESRASSARIGIITALPLEGAALLAMLDERISDVRKANGVYDIGCCRGLNSRHTIVHICMGEMGNNAAAARVAMMLADYPKVEYIIMVGIA
jgi:tetratricopeptide (TPR) repeat protein